MNKFIKAFDNIMNIIMPAKDKPFVVVKLPPQFGWTLLDDDMIEMWMERGAYGVNGLGKDYMELYASLLKELEEDENAAKI